MLIHPSTVAPGDTVTVLVKARIAAGHWIYALGKSGSVTEPTSLEISWPDLLSPLGQWMSTAPKLKQDGSRTYSGTVLFQKEFRVGSKAADQLLKLPLRLKFQTCNEAVCFPPQEITVQAELKVSSARPPADPPLDRR
jgi:hypothetical protein